MTKRITARTMLELRAKIYAAESWTAVRGENKMRRMLTVYSITLDTKNNRLIAVRKPA